MPRTGQTEGKFRVDTLDSDAVNEDGAWWVEVTDAISQGEMPPPDEEDVEHDRADRAKVVDWLQGVTSRLGLAAVSGGTLRSAV